ncbi:pentapeptide repeat-containing protein [Streptomyces sp. WAC04114]|uniref:pentapeptide repeat-containing protein n=1 Tax=Streptomyces sp. WAC04114 TaxID=2867961 RepID=UPI0035AB872C
MPRPRRSAWRSSARPRRHCCGPRKPDGSPRRLRLRPRPGRRARLRRARLRRARLRRARLRRARLRRAPLRSVPRVP